VTLVIQRSADGVGSWTDIAGTTDVASYVVASGDSGYYLRVKETIGGVVAFSSVIGPITGSGPSWPASFFTGPLGAGNVLPVATDKKFLISMFGGYGYSWAQSQTQITDHQVGMGRNYDGIQGHYTGSDTWGGVYGCTDPNQNSPTVEAYAIANGSIPLIAWGPSIAIPLIGPGGAGSADAICQKLGTYWQQYSPHKIMVRLMPEFDLPGTPYGYGNALSGNYTGAQFIAAWQRIVTQIRANCDNVGFWWVPTEGLSVPLTRGIVPNYYPGDAYVDWVGTDCYNVFDDDRFAPNPSQSSPLHPGWADWAELFHYSAFGGPWDYYSIFGNGQAVNGRGITFPGGWVSRQKPFVIGECGTLADPANVNRKRDSFMKILNDANGIMSMPNCVGISFYDVDVSPVSDYDWRVDRETVNVGATMPVNTNTRNGFMALGADARMRGL
jgi:hypothetical protein